jgi:hypothetical protein
MLLALHTDVGAFVAVALMLTAEGVSKVVSVGGFRRGRGAFLRQTCSSEHLSSLEKP